MLFGSLLEAQSENGDNQLLELERELKSKIDKAKNLINNLQATSANGDDTEYATTSTGVSLSSLRISSSPNSMLMLTIMRSSGKLS